MTPFLAFLITLCFVFGITLYGLLCNPPGDGPEDEFWFGHFWFHTFKTAKPIKFQIKADVRGLKYVSVIIASRGFLVMYRLSTEFN